MKAIKLAYRNLAGAGGRTWLSVAVLSIVFVLIIMQFGMLSGWNEQAITDTTNWEIGGGQYYHPEYDPHDPFTLEMSHGKIPAEVSEGDSYKSYCPILISQATIYPQGRMRTIVMKGIDSKQSILDLPTGLLNGDYDALPVIIGTGMARATKLTEGDMTTLRWRDINGTFDATEIVVAGIFKTNVPMVDLGQIWLPLDRMQELTGMNNEATIIVTDKELQEKETFIGWEFKDPEYLLAGIIATIKTKSIGSSFIYSILLALGLLAVFDTQVLAIFRRQKEIGTYIAMGMTRGEVVSLFTVEGAMHSILAVLISVVWGVPFLYWLSKVGFAMPAGSDSYGLALAEKIYPTYGLGLIIITMLVVLITTTIVSYIPSRKISKMNPTEAIKGKIQ